MLESPGLKETRASQVIWDGTESTASTGPRAKMACREFKDRQVPQALLVKTESTDATEFQAYPVLLVSQERRASPVKTEYLERTETTAQRVPPVHQVYQVKMARTVLRAHPVLAARRAATDH